MLGISLFSELMGEISVPLDLSAAHSLILYQKLFSKKKLSEQIVGQSVAPHGILFSGGPSVTGPVCEDLHMEITMLQIYKVALSAGKAHRDHKHHHVHHFDHNGPATSTPAPPPPPVVNI